MNKSEEPKSFSKIRITREIAQITSKGPKCLKGGIWTLRNDLLEIDRTSLLSSR